MHKIGYRILHKMRWQLRWEVLIGTINAYTGSPFQLKVDTYSLCECFFTQFCASSIFSKNNPQDLSLSRWHRYMFISLAFILSRIPYISNAACNCNVSASLCADVLVSFFSFSTLIREQI